MHFIFITVSLYFFWLMLSGHYTLLLLGLGGLSVGLVVWILQRMDRIDGQASKFHLSLAMLSYFAWLLVEVFKANVDVVRRIWDPALPIKPTWQRVDTQVSTPLEKALYANSITLTPGTLTTDVQDDHFMIHCLTPEGIDELKEGEMEKRIRRLGI